MLENGYDTDAWCGLYRLYQCGSLQASTLMLLLLRLGVIRPLGLIPLNFDFNKNTMHSLWKFFV